MYKIVVSHSQNNHAMLSESTPHIDSVDNKAFKYFKFDLLEEDAANVTIELSPLHGDCDLYVSRTLMFPNRSDYEKRSQRIGALVDHVIYERPANESLNGTFYIGVYGYSYTTFSLLVKVRRTHATLMEKLTSSLSTVLYEGFPLSVRLHNELDFFLGHFSVVLDTDQTLLINIENHEGKTKAYLGFNRTPTPLSYDMNLDGEGSLTIKPGDPVYRQSGTY